jgi:hypothetical protein
MTSEKLPRKRSGSMEAVLEGQPIPPWFGPLGKAAHAVIRHDMSAIRESIARGIARDRGL